MKKIPSFTIDHIRLLRGIYVSRKDEVNGEVITTFDIRMKEPNRDRKSTRLNSSHANESRMPSSA